MPLIQIDFDPDSATFGRLLPVLTPKTIAEMPSYQWEAIARLRYCRAYCHGRIYDSLKNRTHTDHGLIPGEHMHTPGCAYATANWVGRAIELLREVNSRG